MNDDTVSSEVRELFSKLTREAESSGYHLNPDERLTMELVQGLLENTERYGYQLCPCRLTSGSRQADLDIVCPCDYRYQDIEEYDTCY